MWKTSHHRDKWLKKNPFIYCRLLTLIVSFFLSIYPVVAYFFLVVCGGFFIFCFVLVLKTLWLLVKDWGKFTCTASAPCMPHHLVHILWATLIDLWATISVVCGFEHLAFLIKCSAVGSQGKKWDLFSITFLFIFLVPLCTAALQLCSELQGPRISYHENTSPWWYCVTLHGTKFNMEIFKAVPWGVQDKMRLYQW